MITAFAIIGVIWYLGVLVRPMDTDNAINAINTFHDMPEDSIEVIAYGSSHTWRSIVPMDMYEEYGLGVYNYGCKWQAINTTYLFIEDSLRTQSPDVILIETYYANQVRSGTNLSGEIYYTRAISGFSAKYEYLYECFGTDLSKYLSYYIPLLAFHENWVDIEADSFYINADDDDFAATMGYYYVDAVSAQDPVDPSIFEEDDLNDSSTEYLDKIVALCEEEGIEIVFFTVPYSGEYNYSDAMAEYAADNNCAYLNLFDSLDEIDFNWDTDLGDSGHLSYEGAQKVSSYLGSYLVENYTLTDMRTIEGNLWEINLQ